MDAVKFLVGSSSSPVVPTSDSVSRTLRKRQDMLKKTATASDRRVRAEKITKERKDKKAANVNLKRGIPSNLECSDDENHEENNSHTTNIKRNDRMKESLKDRMKRLQVFREEKARKKVIEAKTKKPPFRVGAVHHSNYGVDGKDKKWTFNQSARGSSHNNSVFVFGAKRDGETAKNSSMIVGKATSKKLTEPLKTAPSGHGKIAPKVPAEAGKNAPKTPAETRENKNAAGFSLRSAKSTLKPLLDAIAETPAKNAESSPEKSATPAAATPFRTPVSSPLICYERGSSGDRRRRNRGLTPGKTPLEVVGIDDDVDRSPTTAQLLRKEAAKEMDSPPLAERDVNYYRRLASSTKEKLTSLCDSWEAKLDKLANDATVVDFDEILGNIRTTIGQGRLIMNKKGRLHQFEGLIDNCEYKLGEKETTCSDLQGFWDMINFQVEDVEGKFAELADGESRNWQPKFVEKKKSDLVAKKPLARKGQPKKAPVASSSLRQMLAEKRKAMYATKTNIPELTVSTTTDDNTSDVNTFNGGFFKVDTPIKSPVRSEERKTPDLRRSVLSKATASKSSSLTPFAVINATKSIRRSLSRENTPIVKASLDFDMDTDEQPAKEKENVAPRPESNSPISSFLGPNRKSIAAPKENLIDLDSPAGENEAKTPRRSKRLSFLPKMDFSPFFGRKKSPDRPDKSTVADE